MRPLVSPPEKFVIIVVLAFGLVSALGTPLSAGYDEETHFIRAWEMAHLYFVPNEQLGARLPFPAIYWDLSYRRQPIVEPLQPGFWKTYGRESIEARDYVYANVETRSVYSPPLLLPQALIIRSLGLRLHWPALAVYYGCRLLGLLSYLLLTWLAVRVIPYGKWLLAILIVSPMAVFQASTISADTISNGIAFLFIGASLALARREQFGWKPWLMQLGLIALLFLGKVNLLFLALLPFLLIPRQKFRMRYGLVLLAIAAIVLLVLEVVGWNVVAYSRFTRALEGADPQQQVRFILEDLPRFGGIIVRDIWVNTPAYMRGWVGVYGYNYWPVPALTYVLYPVAVAASLLASRDEPLPERRTRWVLGSVFVAGFLLTIISLYVAFTPARSLFVAGVQGRYFTVVMPLLWLALLGIRPQFAARTSNAAAPQAGPNLTLVSSLAAVAALALYSVGLLLSYHVQCGSEFYRWALCSGPQYKNWAPEAASSPPVTSALALGQEIVPACDGMTELRVWVNSRGSDSLATTTLALRAPTQEKDIALLAIENREIEEHGWLTLRFAPEWESGGQLYLLRISGSGQDGPRMAYSQKPEYMPGKLFENDIPLGQDALFQYGCIAGLQRLAGVGR